MKPTLRLRNFLLAGALMGGVGSIHAQTWDNGAGDSNWGTANNWNPNGLPAFNGSTTDIVFDGTASGESFLASARAIRSLTFTSDATTAVTIRTATTLAGTTAANLTLGSATQAGSITFESGTATHTIGNAAGDIVLANHLTVTNNSGSNQTFGRRITGTGFGIIKDGTGSIQFNGAANTFTGDTQINAGTILSASSANFSASTIILNGSTARLRINTAANQTMTRDFEITANGGAISKGGAGTMNYTTGTYTSTGSGNRTLELNNDGTGAATMTSVLSDPSSGTLSINKTGSTNWILAGANTFSGSTTVTAGILSLTNTHSLQNSAIDTTSSNTGNATRGLRTNQTTLRLGGLTGNKNLAAIFDTTSGGYDSVSTLTLNAVTGANYSYSGIIANGAATTVLTKTGAGAQTLSGNNSYTGATNVNGGTLTLSGNRTVGTTGTINVGATGGTILNLSANHTYTGSGVAMSVGASSGAVGAGTVNHTAGTFGIDDNDGLIVGAGGAAGRDGEYNMSGGIISGTYASLNTNRGIMLGGNVSNGTFNLSGSGQINLSNASLVIGRNDSNNAAGADGFFNQTGVSSSATFGSLSMGGSASQLVSVTAELNLSAGTFTANSIGTFVQAANSTAAINISGTADVTLPAFPTTGLGSGSTAVITFDGGVLKNSAVSTNYLGVITTAQIKNGGATFNTTNGNITIAQNLNNFSGHTGTLTKAGSNTLTLSGTNGYTGATTISAGTLALDATGTIDSTSEISLGTNGTFDISAKGVGGYSVTKLTGSGTVIGTLSVSTELAIGNSPGTAEFDALTIGAAAKYIYDVTGNASTADLGIVSGDLTLVSGAMLDVVQLGTYTPGDTFTLFAYTTGSLSGTFAGLNEGDTFTDAGGMWQIFYAADTPGSNSLLSDGDLFVNITAIPEPGATLLGGLGVLLLLRRRR